MLCLHPPTFLLIKLSFNFVAFSGPSTLATFVAVYTLFGPTYPGTYDKDRGVYTLFYPVCAADVYEMTHLSPILLSII